MSIPSKAEFFLNFQQFGDMKLRARNNSDDAGQAVAQQFEGLFVQQMLAAMRSAANLDTSQDSSYMDFYQEMYDKQLAQSIAKQGGLGVAKLILQNMPGNENIPADGTEPAKTATVLDLDLPRVTAVSLDPDTAVEKTPVVL
ncbi:MAG: rod-binding protein, partial [Gammaproteobacteria bacterium]|nr:rod-binding protein [Gammaproteobacteria bacterium]